MCLLLNMKPDNYMSENKVDILSDFFIRDYKPEDFEEINLLWESTGVGGSHRGDTAEVISNTLKNGGQFFVLEQISDNKIAGTAWLTNDSRRIYLHHFCINTSFQGKGLSHYLCEKCTNFARSLNMQIKLEVHKDNQKAVRLYTKAGFTYLGDYHVYIIRDISTL